MNKKYLLAAACCFALSFVPCGIAMLLSGDSNVVGTASRAGMLVFSPVYVVVAFLSLKKREATFAPLVLIVLGCFFTLAFLVGVGH